MFANEVQIWWAIYETEVLPCAILMLPQLPFVLLVVPVFSF